MLKMITQNSPQSMQAYSKALLLYLLYTADLPTSPTSIKANFGDDTALLATGSDPAIVSQKLYTNLLAIQSWVKNGE
jgi:hypothetical protein